MDANIFSAVVRNYVTAVAVLAGVGLAIWKWGFEEWLRRKREIVSPDGHLSSSIVSLDADKAVVTIEALWRNRGSFSIHLDEKTSRMVVTEIDKNSGLGPLADVDTESFNVPLFSGRYVMEPDTESIIHKSFVMPKDKVFMFQCIIGLDKRHSKDFESDGNWSCSREIVINTSSIDESGS